MNNLVWFRRDLRTRDNSALYHAARSAETGVIGVYFVTPQQWKQHHDADCKIQFWLKNVQQLSESLRALNIPLIVKTANAFEDVPEQLLAIAQQHDCRNLYFNREYEVNEQRRDAAAAAAFERAGYDVHQYDDRIIVPPPAIATKDGRFYSVFTPYRKVWDTMATDFSKPWPSPVKQPTLKISSTPVPEAVSGFDSSRYRDDLWPAGEDAAAIALEKFSEHISQYDHARDVPSVNGTSLLSPYLTAGVISPRTCLAAALKISGGCISGTHSGAKIWISELTWRDFYTHVMVGFPRISMGRPFKIKTDAVAWRDNPADLLAWQQGQTGYPLVDAGMRQLNRTGWMHNRLRMVTAMFLTKHLLIDWRLGERYFMQKLIDGDLAANNGGWQWSASTGTDAVPYFRIFNPFSQSKRFDAEGLFIKKMCPELKDVRSNALHDGAKLTKAIADAGADYPPFVVDYKQGRERALAAFKAI